MVKTRLLEIANSIRKNKGQAPVKDVCEQSDLRETFDFDSFDLAELTVKIEAEFKVDVFAEGPIRTFGELCQKLEKPQ